jgi:ribonuclease G
MNNQILINVTPQETRVAVMEQGVPQEIHVERASARGLVGNIYLGKVARVLPGMQSAFIDIGLERAAFLHVADIFGARDENEEIRPIERLLSDGQTLLVQVSKDPIGTKGARLTTHIGMAGRFLVHLPRENHIGVSQRIEDENERSQLRDRLVALLNNQPGGFIVRTVAEAATDKELLDDSQYLSLLWSNIQKLSLTIPPPALLHQDLNLSLRVMRDFITDETERVVVDSRETLQKLKDFCTQYSPSAENILEHYSGERPLFDLFGVEDEIKRALSRRVDLKSGGYLIIDQTEALTTVDVNTGAFVGVRNFDETVFRNNLEAAQAIARQLRLRNLGGIVIADFIDMDSQEHREAVLTEFNKALERDRTRITVNGFTALGLVELTRKRTRESLAHVLCETCPTCNGRGELLTAQTVCYDILREIIRTARQFPHTRQIRILASQKVIDLFLDEESHSLASLCDFIGKEVRLQVQTEYSQENFDVVLS